MIRPLLRALSAAGQRLPHRWRRFLLDDLRLNELLGAAARGQTAEARLPDGQMLTYNILLHGGIVRDGGVEYEEHVLERLRTLMGPRTVFWDVGANIGVFSLIVAGIAREGTVVAFEPEENNLACLDHSIRQNGRANLRVMDCAVGATDGTARFDRHGGAFSGRIAAPDDAAGWTVDVPVRSIDSLVAEGLPPPDVIKIDVEGAEDAVLRGAARTLATHRPIVLCELHAFAGTGGGAGAGAVAALHAADYAVADLDTLEPVGDALPHHILARPRA